MSGVLENIFEASSSLNCDLADEPNETKRKNIIVEYLKNASETILIGDFNDGLEWFNVLKPLSIENQLKGKLVVLDFFTYCCINCLHILPKLREIEESHSVKDGLIVIGVHSAKFDNEKDSKNIISALLRYGIGHPVVNDADGIMWSALGIPCWPTLLVLSPNGNPIFVAVGESNMSQLSTVVQTAYDYYHEKGILSSHEIEISTSAHILGSGPLLFPGKVVCCKKGDHLAIADTGHHRILICSTNGDVQHVVGGTASGHCDGNFIQAKFRSPQGLAFLNCETLYVADTDNNAIRKVEISLQSVFTEVPQENSGEKASDHEDCPSSPWDICITPDESCILIAAAGCHRLWGFFLKDKVWWRKKQMYLGTCVPIAGTGREENRNNAYAHAAAFAQPSGICILPTANAAFVADSESSSIRKVDLEIGSVTAVVGGNRNPTDLFCFGDVDGNQWDVRLQHPLAVAECLSGNGDLYVADSYNHKLKLINLSNRSCHTFLGSGIPGDNMKPGSEQFNEPGGLSASPCGSFLYVADTNNNCVKVVHLKKEINSEVSVHKLNVKLPDSQSSQQAINKKTSVKINVNGGTVIWVVQFELPEGLAFTSAPQKWHVLLPSVCGWSSDPEGGEVSNGSLQIKITVPPGVLHLQQSVVLEATLFLCSSSNLCQRNKLRFTLNIEYDSTAPKYLECNMLSDVKQHKI